jgi:hypothetical protein
VAGDGVLWWFVVIGNELVGDLWWWGGGVVRCEERRCAEKTFRRKGEAVLEYGK